MSNVPYVAPVDLEADHHGQRNLIPALVQCVLSLDDTLTASDMCHLSATCTTARRAAAETPAFWASLDLSLLPHPTAFFTDGISQAARFHGVRALTLRFCDTLRDAHLALLPPSLTALTLDACHAITDGGMKALTITCAKRLQLLSLYWNHHVGNASCLALSLRCPSLTSLSFSAGVQAARRHRRPQPEPRIALRTASGTLTNLARCKGVATPKNCRPLTSRDSRASAVVEYASRCHLHAPALSNALTSAEESG